MIDPETAHQRRRFLAQHIRHAADRMAAVAPSVAGLAPETEEQLARLLAELRTVARALEHHDQEELAL